MSETLYSASAVAQQLGVSRQRVMELAATRNIGRKPTPTFGMWLFTERDIEAMREPRRPGRPRKTPAS